MNIIGEGFHENIITEIDRRQKIQGYRASTQNTLIPQVLDYLYTRTGWVKMISSVDIIDINTLNSPSIKTLGLNGPDLAKKFILFNGISEFQNPNPRGGIMGTEWSPNNLTGNALADGKAYGIGNTQNFGQSPMMGITSANVKTETRGSLKTATIQIKAWNKLQFDIIDNLYLRLGYNVLLEWGYSHYFQNENGDLSDLSPNMCSLENDFFNNKYDYYGLLERAQEERFKSFGNYDALIGRVVNFNWEFKTDGSYDITIILRSQGDVIESLKTNILLDTKPLSITDILVNSGINPNTILQNTIVSQISAPQKSSPSSTTETIDQSTELGKLYYKCKTTLDNIKEIKAGCSVASLTTTDKADILRQQFRDNNNAQYYIRLGSLLEWIENNIIPKLKFNDKTPPILKFDYDIESNLVYTLGSDYSFSSNLYSCLIRSTVVLDNQTYIIAPNAERFLDVVKNKATNTDSKYQAGKLMNIYLNFNFLLNLLNTTINKEDGKVFLIKFLQGICSEINSSLGNVNMLNVTVDEPSNKVVIIDQNSIPDRDKIIKSVSPSSNTETAKFELFGYKNLNTTSSIGTFVQNFSLKTGITPAFASMITIGATAQGYVVGEEATILSRINKGLKDRVKPEILNADYSTTNVTSSLESTKTKFEENAISLAEYIKMIFSPGPSTPPVLAQDLIPDMQSTLRNTIETGEAYNAISSSISNPYVASNRSGFIPFNLSLTIDGLSGMKVYQKFTVNNDYLPSNYPESLEFIVTSINHVIQDNKWITQIESLSLPKTTTQAKFSKNIPSLSNIIPSRPESTGGLFTNFTPKPNERINVSNLQASENAISLIKYFEGIKLKGGLSYPYLDKFANKWTIGYGTTFIGTSPVTATTQPINEAQASKLVISKVKSDFEPAIKKAIKVPLTQNEFDALVVFTYNLGQGRMAGSNLVKLINQKKYVEAANEFLKWANAGGVAVPGLLRRRRNEKYLFEKDSPGNK